MTEDSVRCIEREPARLAVPALLRAIAQRERATLELFYAASARMADSDIETRPFVRPD